MRTYFTTLLLFAFLASSSSVMAQYPEFQNADFEDWEVGIWNLNPTNWEVMNSQLYENTFPDSAAYQGEVAMQMYPFNFFEAVPGLASQEVPCTSIPPALNFAVKCHIEGQDSVKVYLMFMNNGAPVYTAQWATGQSIDNWEEHSIELDQIEPVITSCRIFVQAGYGEVWLEGSPETWISIDAIGVGDPISVEETADASISIYPNPSHDQLKIQGVGLNSQFRIFDMSGRVVSSGNYTGEISIRHLAPGNYVLELMMDDRLLQEKFIKN